MHWQVRRSIAVIHGVSHKIDKKPTNNTAVLGFAMTLSRPATQICAGNHTQIDTPIEVLNVKPMSFRL